MPTPFEAHARAIVQILHVTWEQAGDVSPPQVPVVADGPIAMT
jgi:hypothetical protein